MKLTSMEPSPMIDFNFDDLEDTSQAHSYMSPNGIDNTGLFADNSRIDFSIFTENGINYPLVNSNNMYTDINESFRSEEVASINNLPQLSNGVSDMPQNVVNSSETSQDVIEEQVQNDADLREKVKQLTQKVQMWKSRCDDAEVKLMIFMREREAFNKRKAELEEKEAHYRKVSEENVLLQNEVMQYREMKKVNTEAVQESNVLKKRLTKKHTDMIKVKKLLKETKDAFLNAESENKRLKSQLEKSCNISVADDELNAKCEKLECENYQLQVENQNFRVIIEANEQSKMELAMLRESINRKETELTEMRKHLSDAKESEKKRLSSHSSAIEKLNAKCEKLEHDNYRLQVECENFKNIIQNSEHPKKKLKILKDSICIKDNELSRLKMELEKATAKAEYLTSLLLKKQNEKKSACRKVSFKTLHGLTELRNTYADGPCQKFTSLHHNALIACPRDAHASSDEQPTSTSVEQQKLQTRKRHCSLSSKTSIQNDFSTALDVFLEFKLELKYLGRLTKRCIRPISISPERKRRNKEIAMNDALTMCHELRTVPVSSNTNTVDTSPSMVSAISDIKSVASPTASRSSVHCQPFTSSSAVLSLHNSNDDDINAYKHSSKGLVSSSIYSVPIETFSAQDLSKRKTVDKIQTSASQHRKIADDQGLQHLQEVSPCKLNCGLENTPKFLTSGSRNSPEKVSKDAILSAEEMLQIHKKNEGINCITELEPSSFSPFLKIPTKFSKCLEQKKKHKKQELPESLLKSLVSSPFHHKHSDDQCEGKYSPEMNSYRKYMKSSPNSHLLEVPHVTNFKVTEKSLFDGSEVKGNENEHEQTKKQDFVAGNYTYTDDFAQQKQQNAVGRVDLPLSQASIQEPAADCILSTVHSFEKQGINKPSYASSLPDNFKPHIYNSDPCKKVPICENSSNSDRSSDEFSFFLNTDEHFAAPLLIYSDHEETITMSDFNTLENKSKMPHDNFRPSVENELKQSSSDNVNYPTCTGLQYDKRVVSSCKDAGDKLKNGITQMTSNMLPLQQPPPPYDQSDGANNISFFQKVGTKAVLACSNDKRVLSPGNTKPINESKVDDDELQEYELEIAELSPTEMEISKSHTAETAELKDMTKIELQSSEFSVSSAKSVPILNADRFATCDSTSSLGSDLTTKPNSQTESYPTSKHASIDSSLECKSAENVTNRVILPSTEKKSWLQNAKKITKSKKHLLKREQFKKNNKPLVVQPVKDLLEQALENLEPLRYKKFMFKKLQHSLHCVLINPSVVPTAKFAVNTIIRYLCSSKRNPLMSYSDSYDQSVLLPLLELCIVQTLLMIERRKKLHLHGLVQTFLKEVENKVTQEKTLNVYAVSALCRVYAAICKENEDINMVRGLCYELLSSRSDVAHHTVASMVGVWPEFLQNPIGLKFVDHAWEAVLMKKPDDLSDRSWKDCLSVFCHLCNLSGTVQKQFVAAEIIYYLSNEDVKTDLARTECERALTVLIQYEGWSWSTTVLEMIQYGIERYRGGICKDLFAVKILIQLIGLIDDMSPEDDFSCGSFIVYLLNPLSSSTDEFIISETLHFTLFKIFLKHNRQSPLWLNNWLRSHSTELSAENVAWITERDRQIAEADQVLP